MTEYKILGQSDNDGNEENLYSVPATKSAVVRAINVTNTSSTSDTFDIAINDSAIVPVATPTFVAVARSSQVAATSTDGITWTQRTLPTSANWQSVTYGDPDIPDPITSTDYLFKSHDILGNETITIKGGYTMEENNTLRIKSTNGTSTFHAFGGEI